MARETWTIPDSYPFGPGIVVPLMAGKEIGFKSSLVGTGGDASAATSAATVEFATPPAAYGDFGSVLDQFSRAFQPYAKPCTPAFGTCLVLLLIGCWLVFESRCGA